ncbi:MAG TPA: hypothetical protein VMH86_11250 [Rhizomicrobium sp.]|nr:hypothetical protein [Rhizomicrobium sp.]
MYALENKLGCIMLKGPAEPKSSKAGCIMSLSADAKAGCIMSLSADAKAGCIMSLSADAKAGCIMSLTADAKAGCIMSLTADAKAGCIMSLTADAKAGCIMSLSAGGVEESRLPLAKKLHERAAAWDLGKVKKHAVKKGIFGADEIDRIHAEYVRYIALACAHPDGAIAPSLKVDDFWHAHILFTEDYAAFCQAIAGRFMHHRPTVED